MMSKKIRKSIAGYRIYGVYTPLRGIIGLLT